MTNFIKFPKIEQFRNAISFVKNGTQYIGHDHAADEPMFDATIPLPIIEFRGTVKLHGTNAGIGYDMNTQKLWIQKRNSNISVKGDNAGFAKWVESHRDPIINILRNICISNDTAKTLMYGEWCGEGIQSGVAINQLPKMFVIFSIVKIDDDGKVKDIKRPYIYSYNDIKMFNIHQFRGFKITVDFNNPDVAQKELIKLTEEVEKRCPVAHQLGVSGIGEGIVWAGEFDGKPLLFKTKGEKHSIVKTKKKIDIEPAKLSTIMEFVDYAVTENRLKQSLDELAESNISIKLTGPFIKWIINDIATEEIDVLKRNNLSVKDVNRFISKAAAHWFMNQLDKEAGL